MHFLRCLAILLALSLFQLGLFAQPAGLSELDSDEQPVEDEWSGFDELFEEDLDEGPTYEIHDPFVRVNRAIFTFNDGLYRRVVDPFARGYKKVVPGPVRKGLGNAFRNIKYPTRFAGSVLQGKFKRAGQETGSFLVNSTVGIGGLFNVAKDIDGLRAPAEDFGQAFAHWGIGHGFYVILPVLGPTSLRDFAGSLAGRAVEPLPQPWSQIDDNGTRTLLSAIETINELPIIMDLYESMRRSAIDPYTSVRDAYAQRRARQVAE